MPEYRINECCLGWRNFILLVNPWCLRSLPLAIVMIALATDYAGPSSHRSSSNSHHPFSNHARLRHDLFHLRQPLSPLAGIDQGYWVAIQASARETRTSESERSSVMFAVFFWTGQTEASSSWHRREKFQTFSIDWEKFLMALKGIKRKMIYRSRCVIVAENRQSKPQNTLYHNSLHCRRTCVL